MPNFSDRDTKLIDDCIKKLSETGAIVISSEEQDQFVSKIFTVPKPDGSRRPIINLKLFNSYISNPHFKMESVKTAMTLVSKDCFMAVIDLRDAYHAIPVHESFQKYLKFRWKGILYKYTCIPFGLCLAPWLYTKLNKPIISYLRSHGVFLVSYLDDTLTIGKTESECKKFLKLALNLFLRLGLVVNEEKSQLRPLKQVRFLGFIIDSEAMGMVLPQDKCDTIITKCRSVSEINVTSIQRVAELVGSLVAASPATKYGMLYTRQLEIEKSKALVISGVDIVVKLFSRL